ncbi:MAG: DUF349 domain-containing protein [Flavobacteriaceae bacterium]|nr:DUF349 domain-containing protein [Flavobacteriaceae bacterium]
MLDEKSKLPSEELQETEENTVKEVVTESVMVEEKSEETVASVEKEVTTEEKNLEKEAVLAEKEREKQLQEEEKQKELASYEPMTMEELVQNLEKLLKEQPIQEIADNVSTIKRFFTAKHSKLLKEAKEKFLSEGGNSIDFHYENPLKTAYNHLMSDYKKSRNKYYKEQEALLQQNLELRLGLIEELKALIENANSDTMYQDFKTIQERWRSVGAIPRARYNDTWQTYQHHVERFYDLLHLNKDLRDLDFKYNLEEKLKLVEKAEELAQMKDVNEAFRELQILHKLWKEEIGPVDRSNREEIWKRFSTATKTIHDKRHNYFREMRNQYQSHIEAKLKVVEEMEAVNVDSNSTREDWKKSIDKMEELRKAFFDAGYIPKGKGDNVWDKFRKVNQKFNRSKNQFFKEAKQEYTENIEKKQQLVAQAVSLKDSEDWDITVEVYKKIQEDWKKVGKIPRKHSNKLWKEFKDACNHFFNRYYAVKDGETEELMKVYQQKKEYLEQIKGEVSEETEMTYDKIKGYINHWREMGRVPKKVRHIEGKFSKFLDTLFDKLSMSRTESEMMKFENMVQSYLEQEDYQKLNSEQLFLRKKIDETTREIQQLENNISFISNASSDNPLFKNVNKNIEKHKRDLELYQNKLRYLLSLDY